MNETAFALPLGRGDHGPYSIRAPWFVLEPLEGRLLLDAVLEVTGLGQPIASGENLPSTGDFTDFRSANITVNKDIGTNSRAFEITDTGDAPLDLPKNAITLSGPDKGDFTVTTKAATVIQPGSSSSFTITFKPHGAGLRSATMTIHSNDLDTPAFTFAIQGTGVKTSNLGQNLLSATTQTGTGNSAVVGSTVTVNYTEWLPDGLVVGSSVADPQVPSPSAAMQITIGAHNVIAGWEDGLVGMQAGETRVLFIPADLAYGAAGNSSGLVDVPPNTPIMISRGSAARCGGCFRGDWVGCGGTGDVGPR